ncbi:hypothetical protein AB0M28_36200 [Streptomyces sp. NPDC051940]|uniref:hypothetical protein n=1 Tax=Streptomyces sp. NPDC051940 TaxID=3155675 RepID=UPI00342CFDC7
MKRWHRLSVVLVAVPLLLSAAPGQEQLPGEGGPSYGSSPYGDSPFRAPSGDAPASGGPEVAEDGKNPGQAPAGQVPDFGTFTPPPQGDSDDTPALAAAALAAMALGAAGFVFGWGRKPADAPQGAQPTGGTA